MRSFNPKRISNLPKKPIEEVPVHKVRPLIMGVPLHKIAEGEDHES